MESTQDKLDRLSNGVVSEWSKESEYRTINWKWLRFSSQIARRILAALDDKKDWNQAKLASELKVSAQQVSKIVKGKENLTLQSIARLSEVLGVELISFPAYKYSYSYKQQSQVLTSSNESVIVQSFFTPIISPPEQEKYAGYYLATKVSSKESFVNDTAKTELTVINKAA